jgi:hypothetical protein
MPDTSRTFQAFTEDYLPTIVYIFISVLDDQLKNSNRLFVIHRRGRRERRERK